MDSLWQSPFRRAVIGLLIGTGAGLLIGIVGYGDPWREAIAPAIGAGIGLAVAFAVVHR